MAPNSRQERQQMRQRGAGTRNVDQVDFGFSFAPSTRNTPQSSRLKTRSRTPLTARGPTRRSSRTPAKTPTPTQPEASSSQVSGPSAQPRPSIYTVTNDSPEKQPPKRRKLSSQHTAHLQMGTPGPSQSTAASSRKKPASTRRQSARSQPAVGKAIQVLPSPISQKTPVTTNEPVFDQENIGSGQSKTKTPRYKQNARRARPLAERGQQTRSSSANHDDFIMLSAVGTEGSDSDVLVAVLGDSEESEEEGYPTLMTVQEELPDSTMELVAVLDDSTIDPSLMDGNPAQTPHANIKRKRSSMRTPVTQLNDYVDPAQLSNQGDGLEIDTELPPLPTSPDIFTPPANPDTEQSFFAPNQDEDETYLQPTSPVNPTPKPPAKKPRKKSAAKKSHSTTPSSSRGSVQGSGSFPIQTQRLTTTSALPTIIEDSESETDSHARAGPSTEHDPNAETAAVHPSISSSIRNRPAPNAIDVLLQFCTEDIDDALSTPAPSTEPRATHKRKHKAILTFSNALHTHLAGLSNALEHRMDLEARVRKSAREKGGLRARWVGVREERESLRFELDEVRSQVEEIRARRAEEKSLSEALFRVERDVQRGEGEKGSGGVGVAGLEYRARMLGEKVGSKIEGGLLDKVRALNQTLEGLVGVLEEKRGLVG